jgi:endonuclease/exonuclease/phosphatase family metal-dependent hydrolase
LAFWIAAALLAASLLGSVLGVLWAASGIQRPGTRAVRHEALGVPSPSAAIGDALTVLTWNIAWGYGRGSDGSASEPKPKTEIEATVRAIGGWLKTLGPDLVLLQEVDFDAQRSHRLDEGRLIAELSGLPYYAPAESWRANHVPFPYWPPRRHFGRIRSGGAILSRYPIRKAEVLLLDKPLERSFLYNLFYLFRYLESAELDGGLPVFNTHLDAFYEATRAGQARATAARLSAAMHPLLIYGGDLNTVPPESSLRRDYPDEPQTDHSGDPTLPILRAVAGIRDVLPAETFAAAEACWHTFPAHAPNRKLDFLFVGSGWSVKEARVVTEVGTLSDHLPILVRLERARANPLA